MDENLKRLQDENKALLARVEAAEQKQKSLETEQTQQIESLKHLQVGGRSDSLEAQALRWFDCSHPKELLEKNTEAPEKRDVPAEVKAFVREFKKSVDVSRWIGQIFYGDAKDHFAPGDGQKDRLGHVKSVFSHHYGKDVLLGKLKAFGTGVSGGGAEWVPTAISSSYIAEYLLEKRVTSLFKDVPMPTNPYKMPTIEAGTKARIIGEGNTMTAKNFTTGDITLDATKFGEYMELPEELSEDSAPDVLAAGKLGVMDAHLKAFEWAIINGDDDGTHIDSDTQAGDADLAEKAWKGLRRQAIANTANGVIVPLGNAPLSDTLLTNVMLAGKKFVTDPREAVWIVSPKGYIQMMKTDAVLTVSEFGPMATILQGFLAAYGGIGIVTSEAMREDLNASGVYDGATVNRSGILLVNKTRWYLGRRRPIMVRVVQDSNIANDRWLLASYSRYDFKGHTQSATETSVVYGVNMAL